jgi:glycosyltransferase involved in cell wall biosynthesis
MQIVVLGMHRSGTSSVTRLLNLAGAYFGPDEIAVEPNHENPKGFWERRDLRAALEGLLRGGGFDWWRVANFSTEHLPSWDAHRPALERLIEELDRHEPWVMKDPRLCLLLPTVRPLLATPVCVHVVREPMEVAESLRTRDGFPLAVGIALWELYTIHAFNSSLALPRVLVAFDDIVTNPVSTIDRLVGQLTSVAGAGLHMPSDAEIGAYVDADLRHHHQAAIDRRAFLNQHQLELAAAIDDGRILTETSQRGLSAGARETLATFEQSRDNSDALEARHQAASGRLERARRDQLAIERAASEALRESEGHLRAVDRSRSWRTTWSVMNIRRRMTRGAPRSATSPVKRAIAEIEQARRELSSRTRDDEHPAATPPSRRRHDRPKVAVIAWDAGHNPLGRAFVLAELLREAADVEIWAAQFERFGTRIWAPLRDSDLPIHTFDGVGLPRHLDVMEQVAAKIRADVIWVSKPRLPSLGLGVLTKQALGIPLILDVDDDELAFFASGPDPDVALPFGRTWTEVAVAAVEASDALTVSNVALQDRYGGMVVPHARDERIFDPDRFDRRAVRRALGIRESDRILLFAGTPRVHKGVLEVARALERLGDDRYRLMLFRAGDYTDLKAQLGSASRWITAISPTPFGELPALVRAADLCCALQDADHPVTAFQLPAKVTDAMAMGTPCLVSPSSPLRPLLHEGVLEVHDGRLPLHERIAEVFDDHDAAVDRAQRARKLFLERYSYGAVREDVVPLFERLLSEPAPGVQPLLARVIDAPRERFGARQPLRVRSPRQGWDTSQLDIAMFWKQNDSSIYGRRQDMFLKYLARSDRVRSLLHFDNPISPEALYRLHRDARPPADQSRLVVRETVRRVLHRRNDGPVSRHTYLYGGRLTRHVGLPGRERYADHVGSVLARRGIGTRPLVLWVYPTNPDLPAIIDRLRPDIVVTDLVDDNRTWHADDSAAFARAEENYREVLARSDIVLANCETVAESMRKFTSEVHVVTNGCELIDLAVGPAPAELRALGPGPIIGYVGNLSSRLDIPLLQHAIRSHREWQFVFIGSAHLDDAALRLAVESNVHFLGIKPYDEAVHFVQHFDVALIPHLDNQMTRSMNPLKAYVYCAAGVPVVATRVANLDELAPFDVTVADGPDAFIAAIDAAVVRGRTTPDPDLLATLSWRSRVEQVLELIDATSPRS